MTDIVTRLRKWTISPTAVPCGDLMDEAAAEIERLRNAVRCLADQDATLSVCNGDVTVTMDATLTDEEREAIKQAIHIVDWQQAYFSHAGLGQPLPSATLRSLLERTK